MLLSDTELNVALNEVKFQWAPTLGGECYTGGALPVLSLFGSFNGHPPLGVNATQRTPRGTINIRLFQWAPTLGGECYHMVLRRRRSR